jgi:hypothetical protein
MRFTSPSSFPLYAGESVSLCSAEKKRNNQAIPAATLMFYCAISLAAFGFVTFVLVFVHHPAPQASHADARQAAANVEVPVAEVVTAESHPRITTSK